MQTHFGEFSTLSNSNIETSAQGPSLVMCYSFGFPKPLKTFSIWSCVISWTTYLSAILTKFLRCVVLMRRQVSIGPIKKKKNEVWKRRGDGKKPGGSSWSVCTYCEKDSMDERFTIWTKITQTKCTIQNNEIVLIWGHIS